MEENSVERSALSVVSGAHWGTATHPRGWGHQRTRPAFEAQKQPQQIHKRAGVAVSNKTSLAEAGGSPGLARGPACGSLRGPDAALTGFGSGG